MAQDPNQPDDKVERPRVEPEIIPPDRRQGRGWGQTPYGAPGYGTQRIYVTRLGPFGFALIMLVVGMLGAILLLALIGTALLWIPLVLAFVIIAFVSRLFRR
jgi:hypothetical protein